MIWVFLTSLKLLKMNPIHVSLMRLNTDNKLFLLVFIIALTVFVFTNDGHRYTLDEDVTQKQSMNIATQKPQPGYIQGQSRLLFEYPDYFPLNDRPICQNGILCSQVPIGSSLTQVPFILINKNLHIINNDIQWSSSDFDDPHYVWWRNTLQQEPDFIFLELFYGPVFSALAVGTFFLVCRTFNYERNTSIVLSMLYGFTTTIWAYSQTSLNAVPATFFFLLGILFFRRFQSNQSKINLILCGMSLGYAFLTRNDIALLIVPLFVFFLYDLKKRNDKVKKFFAFVIPTVASYGIYHIINFIRIGTSTLSGVSTGGSDSIPLYIGIFGLLLSPGVGLLIFAPILLTSFFSFPDFYKKNKPECILFLSFAISLLIFYGPSGYWHGLNAWGARYLLVIVPFLLLPLGASLEKRKSNLLKTSIVVLGGLGIFFNLVYLIQDVSWFVWGIIGSGRGLYELGHVAKGLWVHPLVLWTFEYSQLTHSIILAFTKLQPDIFLLKVWGTQTFMSLFAAIMSFQAYLLYRLLKNESDAIKQKERMLHKQH